jgi:hypothetical protein
MSPDTKLGGPDETAQQHPNPDQHDEIQDQDTSTAVDTPGDGLFQLAGKPDDDEDQEVDLDAEIAAAKAEAAELLDDQDVGRLPEGVAVDDDGTVHYGHGGTDLDLVLSADHWRELTVESAIDPALVVARGYWTIEDSPKAQGFLKSQGITPKAQQPEHFPGLLVFMHRVNLVEENGIRLQWKPATPLLDRNGKPQKYISQLKAPNCLDVHPSMHDAARDPSVRLWVGEGVKKGDSLASRGEAVVNLTGVWNWRTSKGPVVDWEEIPLKDREVLIIYDADAWTKSNVLAAMSDSGPSSPAEEPASAT